MNMFPNIRYEPHIKNQETPPFKVVQFLLKTSGNVAHPSATVTDAEYDGLWYLKIPVSQEPMPYSNNGRIDCGPGSPEGAAGLAYGLWPY